MNGRIVHAWPEARVKSRVRLPPNGPRLGTPSAGPSKDTTSRNRSGLTPAYQELIRTSRHEREGVEVTRASLESAAMFLESSCR